MILLTYSKLTLLGKLCCVHRSMPFPLSRSVLRNALRLAKLVLPPVTTNNGLSGNASSIALRYSSSTGMCLTPIATISFSHSSTIESTLRIFTGVSPAYSLIELGAALMRSKVRICCIMAAIESLRELPVD